MNLWQAVVLGIVQGLTEFLPISSSGHLAIAEGLLGLPPGDLTYEVILHLATLVAVCLVFRRRLWKMVRAVFRARIRIHKGRLRIDDENLRLFLLILLATIPAAVIGYLLEDIVEQVFASIQAAALGLLVTGAVLFGTKFPKPQDRPLNWRRATAIGLAQAVAILPGISRSGATIGVGIYSGLRKDRAAEFSFLLSIPVILGAGLLKLKNLPPSGRSDILLPLAAGGLAALICGLLAIKWLLALIKKRRLDYFAYYCWLLGIGVLIWSWMR